ncbi:MAG: ATP-binding cassette domain-containing protein [Verrucomicrobiota bacterium]
MIEVRNLTKRFAGRTVLDGVTFEVNKGEIVGFLGPNGAGKTTTLRILTTYLSATSGSATVAGCDVFNDSLKLRKKIGYLPENVPLYADMRVKEYLRFRAQLRGLRGRNARQAVGAAMDETGITDVRKKVIGTLSKGYRQRVGLADAIVHSPDLLILDEPTNGLDPNQIRHARDLIHHLGQEHTILVSTHILHEVEMTCDRVIIIDRGRIMAADTPRNLVQRLRTAGTVSLDIKSAPPEALAKLQTTRAVKRVTQEDSIHEWTRFTLRVESGADIREDLFHLALQENWTLRELTQHSASLEDVFADITEHSMSISESPSTA